MSDSLRPPEGVSEAAWARIAKHDGTRWAIVERDSTGMVIGTAHRYPGGRKGTEAGSKRGLILPWPLDNEAGTSDASPVYVTEGASDTAALLTLGLDAVGVPMAGHCGEMLASLLAGRHVVVVADADETGRSGAAKITQSLAPRCASVRVMEPPNKAQDARQAVIDGADARAFAVLAASHKRVTPPPRNGTPIIIDMDAVEPEDVRWLWPGRIPLGRLTVLSGRPGEGKSFATCDWAARVSTGRSWPDGSPCEAGSVLLVAAEDDPADPSRNSLDEYHVVTLDASTALSPCLLK